MWIPEDHSQFGLVKYYEDEFVTLFIGDNTDYLAHCPRNSFNIVHTDPPYNEVNRENIEGWAYFDKGEADDLEVDAMLVGIQCGRIASEWAYIWCGTKQFSDFIKALETVDHTTRIGGWTKASPVPTAASKKWLSAFELCAIGRKPNANFNLHAASPIFYGEREFVTSHPTEKPLWLVTSYLEAVAHEGATVLDPFAGSGSTLEAAKKLGMKSVGIEINPTYCKSIADRLSIDTLF